MKRMTCASHWVLTSSLFCWGRLRLGSSIKFNWVLQIEPPEDLKVQGSYQFEKSGNRVFPLDTPIDLIDLNRNAMAKIKVVSFLNSYTDKGGVTTGNFEVIKIYTGTEKSVLSNYWVENE